MSERIPTDSTNLIEQRNSSAKSELDQNKALNQETTRIIAAYELREHKVPNTRYSHLDRGNVLFLQEIERGVLDLLKRGNKTPLAGKSILEIGCGTGRWLREFTKWGADPEGLSGIDLLTERLEVARKLCARGVHLERCNGGELPFRDNSFDVVLQATVFTSILDYSMKQKVATEMLRVLKPDGIIIWYDFHVNNPWNGDVRGVPKKEIRQLFAGCDVYLERISLVPPIGRLVGRRSLLLYALLSKMKVLCTHYLGLIRKN